MENKYYYKLINPDKNALAIMEVYGCFACEKDLKNYSFLTIYFRTIGYSIGCSYHCEVKIYSLSTQRPHSQRSLTIQYFCLKINSLIHRKICKNLFLNH